ncbi:cilia- and flagella-associated protein 251-like [Coffea eugenioides]|uniref:cilia- and flagella-associated protein 251-like n=1 Tax=Coffea eugenioides TaxID=49369 RepID=UPI000F60C4FD|nr:cilia- and flagella-associated protein 251-like [Coffea eugenioides]
MKTNSLHNGERLRAFFKNFIPDRSRERMAEFGKDNTVELGDFLVFQYDGNCVYDVILLGHNACEKKGVGAFKVKEKEEETKGFEEDDEVKEGWDEEGKSNEFGKEEEEEAEDDTNKVEKKEEEVKDDEKETNEDKEEESYSDATEMDEDSDYKMEKKDDSRLQNLQMRDAVEVYHEGPNTSHIYNKNHSRRYTEKEEEEGKEVEIEEKEEDNEIETKEGKKENRANELQKEEKGVVESYTDATEMVTDFDCIMEEEDNSTEKEEEKEEGEIAKIDKPVDTIASKHSCKDLKMFKGGDHINHAEAKAAKGKRRTTRNVDHYGRDLFKSRRIPQPKNPYFVIKLKAKRKDELYVPIDVVRDHNLTLPQEIILVDQQGRERTATLNHWKDGRL